MSATDEVVLTVRVFAETFPLLRAGVFTSEALWQSLSTHNTGWTLPEVERALDVLADEGYLRQLASEQGRRMYCAGAAYPAVGLYPKRELRVVEA